MGHLPGVILWQMFYKRVLALPYFDKKHTGKHWFHSRHILTSDILHENDYTRVVFWHVSYCENVICTYVVRYKTDSTGFPTDTFHSVKHWFYRCAMCYIVYCTNWFLSFPIWHVSYSTTLILQPVYFNKCHTVQNWLFTCHILTRVMLQEVGSCSCYILVSAISYKFGSYKCRTVEIWLWTCHRLTRFIFIKRDYARVIVGHMSHCTELILHVSILTSVIRCKILTSVIRCEIDSYTCHILTRFIL